MWIVLLVNVIVAAVAVIFGFQNRVETLNLFNAGIVFITFVIVLLLGAIPVYQDFSTSSILMFIAGILIIVRIIMLAVSLITKVPRTVNLQYIAISLMIAAVCLIYFMHGLNLSLSNLVVPELALIIGIILFYFKRKRQ